MTRSLLFVLASTLVLGLWARAIARDEEALRASRSRVGHLLTPEERALGPLAAVIVETGGTSLLYGRVQGEWRCREYHLAPADTAAIESLHQKLVGAEGTVHTSEVDEAPTYGINTPQTIRVSFCGPKVLEAPDRDVLFAFDVGKAVPGRDGAFVRRRGTKEIWAIGSNPRIELTSTVAPGLPPMLEKGVLPRSWAGWRGDLQRIFVDHEASGYELERRLLPLDPAEMKPGELPWSWILDPGPNELTAGAPSQAYAYFLQQVPYLGVLPSDRFDELGLAAPRARVTLAAAEDGGAPLEAHVSRARPDGTAAVWVPLTKTLYLVSEEVAGLLAPDRALFLPGREDNPWDGYLRQASGTGTGPAFPPNALPPR